MVNAVVKAVKKSSEPLLPPMLAESRCVQPSVGLLLSVTEGKDVPIPVNEMTVRGSVSNYGAAYGVAKDQATARVDAPNPQSVDTAVLPDGCERLALVCSINFLPVDSDLKRACSSLEFARSIDRFVDTYTRLDGFLTLGNLYAWRIASGAMLWRNRYGIDKRVMVKVRGDASARFVFEADAIDIRSPDEFLKSKTGESLARLIAAAFAGTTGVLMLEVRTEVTVGNAQEVFPSQSFAPGDIASKTGGKKSKLLFKAMDRHGNWTAAMHPQKIGAALRQFDVWHQEFKDVGPLVVEPLGYSHPHQAAFRQRDTEQDLYRYLLSLDRLLLQDTVSKEAHFVMANLIRGGVFSGESKKRVKEDESPAESPSTAGSEEPASNLF